MYARVSLDISMTLWLGLALAPLRTTTYRRGMTSLSIYERPSTNQDSVIVFSEGYGDSRWCLSELVEITNCWEKGAGLVLPVFYHVKPSHVRKQEGSFERAFVEHERSNAMKKVNKWRKALKQAGSLSGFVLQEDSDEATSIKLIVEHVMELLPPLINVPEHLVGVDSRVKELTDLLSVGLDNVRIIGIYGMGGIGKTTIANALYNQNNGQFEWSRFFEHAGEVAELCSSQMALDQLEKLDVPSIVIPSNDTLIQQNQKKRRVLIIVDDVDYLTQLNRLVQSLDWFGLGSRVVIITRNTQIFEYFQVNEKYEMKELSEAESLELFRHHALKSEIPSYSYEELSSRIVNYARGLPLALEVLGSSLIGATITEWQSLADKLQQVPGNVDDMLKISFDLLKDKEVQDMFLDIACFFCEGWKLESVSKMLDACGLHSKIGIRILTGRCLLRVDEHNFLWMHDLIRDIGREIVRMESPKDPGRRSRLWKTEDVLDILENEKGRETVEAILLDGGEIKESPKEKAFGGPRQFSTKTFARMTNLRLLDLKYVELNDSFDLLPRNIRWLSWSFCNLECLPSDFHLEKLCGLSMRHSYLRNLKVSENLTFLDLHGSAYLTTTPDFTSAPLLETLILQDCARLEEIHPSIGVLKRLVYLNCFRCYMLRKLPSGIGMLTALEYLNLSGCKAIEDLPEDFGNLQSLKFLDISRSSIREWPLSFGHLKNLQKFMAGECNVQKTKTIAYTGSFFKSSFSLTERAHSADHDENYGINDFESDYKKELEMYSSLKQSMPDAELQTNRELGVVSSQQERYEDCITYCTLFPTNYKFSRETLVCLWIAVGLIQARESERLEEAGNLCFDKLNSEFLVPFGYDHLSDQISFKLSQSIADRELPGPRYGKIMSANLVDLSELEHTSLCGEDVNQMAFENLRKCNKLITLLLHGCNIIRLPDDLFLYLNELRVLDLSHTRIVELPSSIGKVKPMRYLDVSETPIRHLPEFVGCLDNLQTLRVIGCSSLTALPRGISKLINLRHLFLDGACKLKSVPAGIGRLTSLQTLRIFLVGSKRENSIKELKDMNNLSGSLRILNLENVSTEHEAAIAALSKKKYLKKLELQWSDLRKERAEVEAKILENLEPHRDLEELKIVFYGGRVLPSWINDDASFHGIVSITFYKCRQCNSLPSLGELPSLKFLSIVEMNEVGVIGGLFCRKQFRKGDFAFPHLEKLTIDGMSNLVEWTGVKSGDFSCLCQLTIAKCPKLVALPFLSYLKSLKYLEISYCPEFSCFPEKGIPDSLEYLMVKDSPKLKEQCSIDNGRDWPKVAHVPAVYMDYQKISKI